MGAATSPFGSKDREQQASQVSWLERSKQRRKPKSYASRAIEGLKRWKEARRSSKLDDSIFIRIPKNAGTSVLTMLRPYGLVGMGSPGAVRHLFRNSGRVAFGHMELQSLIELDLISREFVERAFKFTIVRDPYSRAVSLYRYLSGTVMSNWHKQPNFREFLLLLANGYYDRLGPYVFLGLSPCNPQVEWLRSAWPDKIYRFEDLEEFACDISERWGIPRPDIVHANPSTGNDKVELTRDERALIEQIYAEDFETFGYAKR